jgi:hypothetical protein
MDGDIEELEERVRILELRSCVWMCALIATLRTHPNRMEAYGLFQLAWSGARRKIQGTFSEEERNALKIEIEGVALAFGEDIV